MSTASPLQSCPKESRRRCISAAGVLLVLMTQLPPTSSRAGLRQRELNAIYREIETSDPNWRWRDLIANLPDLRPTPKTPLAGAEGARPAYYAPFNRSVVLNTKARPRALPDEEPR